MKLFEVILFFLILSLNSCVKNRDDVDAYVSHSIFSQNGDRIECYFLIKDDTCRNCFTLQRIRKEIMLRIWKNGTMYMDDAETNFCVSIDTNRFRKTQQTLSNLSLFLKELNTKSSLDSIGYIIMSTDDVVEIGIEMSDELLKEDIKCRSTLPNAVSKTYLKRELNKVLVNYNLKATNFKILYDSKAIDIPIEYVPVQEMNLKLKCDLPPKFVWLLMMIEVHKVHDKR